MAGCVCCGTRILLLLPSLESTLTGYVVSDLQWMTQTDLCCKLLMCIYAVWNRVWTAIESI